MLEHNRTLLVNNNHFLGLDGGFLFGNFQPQKIKRNILSQKSCHFFLRTFWQLILNVVWMITHNATSENRKNRQKETPWLYEKGTNYSQA
jgi:hypothetical protein